MGRRTVKREATGDANSEREHVTRSRVDSGNDESTQQDFVDRRLLRSKYLALYNKINDERDDLMKVDSNNFTIIIKEFQDLHQHVKNPREQVADAEALLGITKTLLTSVKSQSSEGITAAKFVSCLLAEFGQFKNTLDHNEQNCSNSIKWKEIGIAISPSFQKCNGLSTMVGPVNTELKQRTVAHRNDRKHTRPTERAHPEEVDDTGAEEKTETDNNMSTMFEILRRKRNVRLENLVLNRRSFAQTVENLFALSFLVKDGRVEITVVERGSHLVSPRNAPAANSIISGDATYRHCVFRFDFEDWKLGFVNLLRLCDNPVAKAYSCLRKLANLRCISNAVYLMKDMVFDGDELMPDRKSCTTYSEPAANISQGTLNRTPIRKLSRNRGLVVQQDSIVEESPEIEASKGIGSLRCKRKLA